MSISYTSREIAINIVQSNPDKKLNSIKEYRHATRCGLIEAKKAIEKATEDIVYLEWLDKLYFANGEPECALEDVIRYFEVLVYGESQE